MRPSSGTPRVESVKQGRMAMTNYSVVLCGRSTLTELVNLLDGLRRSFKPAQLSYEVLQANIPCWPDSALRPESLAQKYPELRLLGCEPSTSIDALLTQAIVSARGERIVAIEASGRYPIEQIVCLIELLVRADFVQGKRQRRGVPLLLSRLARIPRWALLGLEVRDPGCLFWAARREALPSIRLRPGMHRYLATLVAAQGYRVTETSVLHHANYRRRVVPWPGPNDLFRAWRFAGSLRQSPAIQPSSPTEILQLPPAPIEVQPDQRKSA